MAELITGRLGKVGDQGIDGAVITPALFMSSQICSPDANKTVFYDKRPAQEEGAAGGVECRAAHQPGVMW